MLMGVDVEQIESPFKLPPGRSEPVPEKPGRIVGVGTTAVVGREANADLTLINRLLESGAHLAWTPAAITVNEKQWPAGSIFVKQISKEALQSAIADLPVTVTLTPEWPDTTLIPMRLP